ncbi:hypothetical protein UFOVP1305_8 [uncultured Caudovirales phage]|uniref:Uncharacterized protein n=1 Tax=uncultured Caudovirales phage TaxID=2100421 RepID=A0A6J5PEN2_9CAUD|nr:hypothetical protein UFOVP896_46 [uncultured Caudovirales phage]CAB4197343.1 hypothetical protein UFOVP1305_8 [uncultured Caudovirales phage]
MTDKKRENIETDENIDSEATESALTSSYEIAFDKHFDHALDRLSSIFSKTSERFER